MELLIIRFIDQFRCGKEYSLLTSRQDRRCRMTQETVQSHQSHSNANSYRLRGECHGKIHSSTEALSRATLPAGSSKGIASLRVRGSILKPFSTPPSTQGQQSNWLLQTTAIHDVGHYVGHYELLWDGNCGNCLALSQIILPLPITTSTSYLFACTTPPSPALFFFTLHCTTNIGIN